MLPDGIKSSPKPMLTNDQWGIVVLTWGHLVGNLNISLLDIKLSNKYSGFIFQGTLRYSCHFSGRVIVAHRVHGIYFQQINRYYEHIITQHVLSYTIPTHWQERTCMKLKQFVQPTTYSFNTDISYMWLSISDIGNGFQLSFYIELCGKECMWDGKLRTISSVLQRLSSK